eukprot:265655_1
MAKSTWYSLPHSILAQTRSNPTMRAVLKMASDPATLLAMEKSLETKKHTVKVLQMANNLQIKALANDLPALSAPPLRPALLLFMTRSPMNMVAALEKKSEPTTLSATAMLPLNLRAVIKVTIPAMTRQVMAFTAERRVVSEKEAS